MSAPPAATVAEVKARLRAGQRRVFRPWVAEPGLWLQWDWGEGPRIGGRRTNLWCAWLAWSRFRVVIPVWDKTLPTIVACLDTTLRRIGGVPTYALTDNERTVTIDHVARDRGAPPGDRRGRPALRHDHPHLCARRIRSPRAASEATVRIAKADLVPTDGEPARGVPHVRPAGGACREFCEQVNARAHRETRRPPVEMLAEERTRLHPLPTQPFTVAFGTTRRVNWDATVSVEGVRYSVPHQLVDTRVWVRFHGDDLVVTAVGPDGTAPAEVARHPRSTPGTPVDPRRALPAARRPPKRTASAPRGRPARPRAAFLALGPGAASWLVEAAAAGARAGPAEDGRGRRAGQAAPTRRGRPRPRARPRSPAGSPRTTCCASWPTRPAATVNKPTDPGQ